VRIRNIVACILSNQGQHESVSRYRGVRSVVPTDFFELLLSLAIFWLVRRMLIPTGIYDFVWHPALFNTALYCCLFYLLSRLFV
jgi:hypothetical protein